MQGVKLARLARFGCIALALLVGAGCSAKSDPTTLRLAISSEPHSLDPLFEQGIPDNDVVRLMFDPLVASDAAGNPVPALAAVVPTAANGGVSADGLTITYHLRHGVRWHDGAPFTSRDVLFSTHAVLDARNNVQSRRGFDAIASVTAPDASTVIYRLKHRFSPFVATVFAESDSPYYIVPEHLLGTTTDLERATFSRAPVGTGPFKFVSLKHAERLVLEANPSYFGGAPKFAHVVVRFIPDENTEMAELRTGELDGIVNLSATAAAQLHGIGGVHIIATPENGYYGVMFNVERVKDVRVRRALAVGLDTQAFRQNIVHGFYTPAIADLPSFLWAADRTLAPQHFDPDEARVLMKAAGYGGNRRYPFDLAIIGNYKTHQSWAVQIQSDWKKIGVDVRIKPYLGTVFAAPAAENGILATGRYDGAIYGWVAGMDPDDSSQFLCGQRPPVGYNDARYCTKAMDAAQTSALERYDRPARVLAYATIEALLLRDVPIAYAATPASLIAMRDGIKGVAPNPICETVNAQAWSR